MRRFSPDLTKIPGVSATAAHAIIAEIGVDMSRFATVGHLRSWAGLCPQLNESAGKVISRRLRYGGPWLKTVLVQCAWAANRSKHSYLHAQFLRLRARRRPKKPSWRWRPRSLLLPITCFAIRCPIAISERCTWHALTRIEPSNASPTESNSSATKSKFKRPLSQI